MKKFKLKHHHNKKQRRRKYRECTGATIYGVLKEMLKTEGGRDFLLLTPKPTALSIFLKLSGK